MRPRLAAPWYVHPAADPVAWARLREGAPLAFAVVNVADGPGEPDDPYYPDALAQVATPLVGYVDVGYGRRPRSAILQDAGAWRERYGCTGVMLDQVPSDERSGAWSLDILDALRTSGCDRIVANPGTVPCPALLTACDVTCVFEGNLNAYLRWRSPSWVAAVAGPGRIWHMVHSCPEWLQPAVARRAGRRGAGLVWTTAGTLPNPWSTLQKRW